jgi:hypothetical protein
MKTRIRSCASLLGLCATTWALAQDGDLLTSSLLGRGFFEAVPLSTIPGSPVVAPFNLNVGTSPFSLAKLNVRGDQLAVNDQFNAPFLCTFRTDVLAGSNQNWSMVRGITTG